MLNTRYIGEGPSLAKLNTRYIGEGPSLEMLNTRYIGEGPPLEMLNTRYIGEGPSLAMLNTRYIGEGPSLEMLNTRYIGEGPSLAMLNTRYIGEGPPLEMLNTRYIGEGPSLEMLNTRYIGEGPSLEMLNTRYIGEGPSLEMLNTRYIGGCPPLATPNTRYIGGGGLAPGYIGVASPIERLTLTTWTRDLAALPQPGTVLQVLGALEAPIETRGRPERLASLSGTPHFSTKDMARPLAGRTVGVRVEAGPLRCARGKERGRGRHPAAAEAVHESVTSPGPGSTRRAGLAQPRTFPPRAPCVAHPSPATRGPLRRTGNSPSRWKTPHEGDGGPAPASASRGLGAGAAVGCLSSVRQRAPHARGYNSGDPRAPGTFRGDVAAVEPVAALRPEEVQRVRTPRRRPIDALRSRCRGERLDCPGASRTAGMRRAGSGSRGETPRGPPGRGAASPKSNRVRTRASPPEGTTRDEAPVWAHDAIEGETDPQPDVAPGRTRGRRTSGSGATSRGRWLAGDDREQSSPSAQRRPWTAGRPLEVRRLRTGHSSARPLASSQRPRRRDAGAGEEPSHLGPAVRLNSTPFRANPRLATPLRQDIGAPTCARPPKTFRREDLTPSSTELLVGGWLAGSACVVGNDGRNGVCARQDVPRGLPGPAAKRVGMGAPGSPPALLPAASGREKGRSGTPRARDPLLATIVSSETTDAGGGGRAGRGPATGADGGSRTPPQAGAVRSPPLDRRGRAVAPPESVAAVRRERAVELAANPREPERRPPGHT
ncbi:hypothetical protein Bbelb_371390 [Branchiostoma belcheri]|nr:hypothetical protein Bbelb_371390 [Branchiostoma belcheri]